MKPAWHRPLPTWRVTLPEWRRPMVVWRTRLPAWQRLFPAWRRALPVAGPLLAGALGYLLLGAGPRSNVARNMPPADWALPTEPVLDLVAADGIWAQRMPWGAAASAGPGGQPAPAAVLVGVIVERGDIHALFAVSGAPILEVREGDALPGGGRVTAISRNQVTWTDSVGQAQQRELLVAPREPQVPPPPAPEPQLAPAPTPF